MGAPRAEALPLQRANRTGGLYSCDITSRGPCTRIEFDNDGMFSLPCSFGQLICTVLGKESQEFILTERTTFNFVSLDYFICPENTSLNHTEVGQFATFV